MTTTASFTATPQRATGTELLNDVAALVRRYVVMEPEAVDAVALWVAHTWAVEAAYITPYLAITSAVSESGKSTLLRVLERLVRRPWKTGRVTPAVLARRIDGERPTLLLDETDAAFGSGRSYTEMIRGILNEGFTRGGVYSVVAGDGYRDFAVFGPKALAGIGGLPDTLASRSIPIRLRRRKATEQVAELEPWELEDLAAPIRLRLERWAGENLRRIETAKTDLPATISDRSKDVWRPLAAIAAVAEGDWSSRVYRSAERLSERRRAAEDRAETRTLLVIRDEFDASGVDRLATTAIAEALASAGVLTPEKASGEAAGHAVSRLLRPFEIGTAQKMRIGLRTVRGYTRTQFEDSFERYL